MVKKNIIGFGASSMAGVGDSIGEGFFKRIQSKLTNYSFINLGVGGFTTKDMLIQSKKAENFKPYDLIVLLGCNDLPRKNDSKPQNRTTLDEYEQNLDKILTQIKGEKNTFITSFPVDFLKSGISSIHFESYIACAKSVAIKNQYEVIDLYSIIKNSQNDFLASDGMHFNSDGHQFIADLIIKNRQ